MSSYPDYVKKMVRQHIGLDNENDISRDGEIDQMTPNEVFDHVLEWDGFLGYSYTIKGWIKDIYGVDLGS